MNTWARPGVKCVCVDASPGTGWSWQGDGPVKGAVYTLAATWIDKRGKLVGEFTELKRSPSSCLMWKGEHIGYNIRRFRPFISQADDIALIKSLIEPG